MPLLKVQGLKTYFYIENSEYPAVDDVSFTLDEGRILAVIGESGSGKSVMSMSIMGLIDPPGKISGGHIIFKGEDLLEKTERQMRRIRGNEISMIYQDPMSALDPLNKAGDQISEALMIHKKAKKREARSIAFESMRSVGISDAEKRYDHLPEHFSGGMRQRLMIAVAISCKLSLLIADEPTTALDVTIQADILDLICHLKDEINMSVILNTHDLGIVAKMADDIIVMYCGQIMESAPCKELFDDPRNPYTRKLMSCIPRADKEKGELDTIKGYVPHLTELPKGCRFRNRCDFAKAECAVVNPKLVEVKKGHFSRCILNDR